MLGIEEMTFGVSTFAAFISMLLPLQTWWQQMLELLTVLRGRVFLILVDAPILTGHDRDDLAQAIGNSGNRLYRKRFPCLAIDKLEHRIPLATGLTVILSGNGSMIEVLTVCSTVPMMELGHSSARHLGDQAVMRSLDSATVSPLMTSPILWSVQQWSNNDLSGA